MKIIKPTLLLDETRCKANIRRMAEKANRNEVIFRPHFKTHQSLEIGNWFQELGVDKITVSSLDMANYFADGGWTDITVAFPVNILEIEMINTLASRINLNLLVESAASIDFLAQHLTAPVSVFIKVDMGYNRTGVATEDLERLTSLTDAIAATELLNFKGFLGHAGNSYDARGVDEILSVYQESTRRIKVLKDHFIEKYPDLILSVGDTPTCSQAEDFSMVDEIRPGNFVFYDVVQEQIGSCTMDEIAVAMACPVVAIHQDRQEIIIYGGGVHFSKDRIVDADGRTIWGRVVAADGAGWGKVLDKVYLKKLSQEHGTISAADDYLNQIRIGDIIKVLPVHSCMTVDCMDVYKTLSGRTILKL